MNTTDAASDGGAPRNPEQPQQQQPQQFVIMAQPQTVQPQTIQPYSVNQVVNDDATENYLYSGKVGDLTICHWLACLFCNCCFCALIGFILNQVVEAAKMAGYHKLAFHVAQKAKCWMITACVCTLIPWIILCIMFAAGNITTSYISDQLSSMGDNN